ncbi:MAG TPA: GGDEF domain-containing protein [Azonexus sp.]|nr:GGDEF domain-containing protein [Azonexus sp.]
MEDNLSLRNRATHDPDPTQARQVITALGLAADQAMTRKLRSVLTADFVATRVDACLARLAHLPDFSPAGQNHFGEAFRQSWIDYLNSFGLDFDTPAYFAGRRNFPAACAHAGIPLAVWHLQHSLMLQSIVECLATSEQSADDIRLLTVHAMKLGELDTYLATASHSEARIDALQKALAEAEEKVSRLHHKTSTDQLTGLTSFSSLMEQLEQQVRKAEERRQPLCVLMADLDYFKNVNDTYGHLVGDMVLRHTAKRIRAAVRDFDIAGRFGGEEFTVILKNTDISLAQVVAERIRDEIGSTPMHVKGANISITISLGGAMMRQGETKEALLGRADTALYEAKQAGRNRVIFAAT